MGERFVEVDRNLHKNSKGGVFQKSKRFCNLLFLQKMIFFVFPLDRNNIGCPPILFNNSNEFDFIEFILVNNVISMVCLP